MKAKHVLTIHTSTFIVFVLWSLSAPFLALRFQHFFSSPFYFIAVITGTILTMVAWKVYGGCPFTVWENRLREIEQAGSTYVGSCLTYYTQKWFGWKIPNKFFSVLLASLLILPIIAGIL